MLRDVQSALARAKASHRYPGDYVLAPVPAGLRVTWVGQGSRADIDRRALHDATVELETAGFLVSALSDRLVVHGVALDGVVAEHDGEACVHSVDADESTVRECELQQAAE